MDDFIETIAGLIGGCLVTAVIGAAIMLFLVKMMELRQVPIAVLVLVLILIVAAKMQSDRSRPKGGSGHDTGS